MSKHSTPVPVRRVLDAAYFDALIARGERAFAGINARSWESYWESQEKENRYWEHVSRMPRLQLRHIRNRNHGRQLHRRNRG